MTRSFRGGCCTPTRVTPQQVAQQDTNDMIASQEEAKIAALEYLGYPLKPGVDIASVVLPALKGKSMPDDIIVGVDCDPGAEQ